MNPIGIIGGGQLARMLSLAAHPLGLRCRVLDPSAQPPAAAVAEHVRGALDERAAIEQFTDGLSVATCELEHVPEHGLAYLESLVEMRPRAAAVRVARDRWQEKSFLRGCGVETAEFRLVGDELDLERAIEELGLPLVLKTRTNGYDGRGQKVVCDRAQALSALAAMRGASLIAESWVEFDRELSVAVVRSVQGDIEMYPAVENRHTGGVLRWTVAPAPDIGAALSDQLDQIARTVVLGLDYAGVLVIELFQVGQRLLVNELAPRVHNSGHWTIEGAETSQFENHLRAILGLPLGSTSATGGWVMFNLLGGEPDLARVLELRGAHLHLYGKAARPGRKIGHVNCRTPDPWNARSRLQGFLGLS